MSEAPPRRSNRNSANNSTPTSPVNSAGPAQNRTSRTRTQTAKGDESVQKTTRPNRNKRVSATPTPVSEAESPKKGARATTTKSYDGSILYRSRRSDPEVTPPSGNDGSILYRSRRSEPEVTPTPGGKKVGRMGSARSADVTEPPAGSKSTSKQTTPNPSQTSEPALPKTPAAQSDSDVFCWSCHAEGRMICCEVCPRVYHSKCLALDSDPADGWTCPECLGVIQAETVEPTSKGVPKPSQDQLAVLLRFALQRMKCQGSEPFQHPVDVQAFPQYREFIFKPMDLSQLEKNVQAKQYGSTEGFVADAKWILHNCVIFNGGSSKLSNIARTIMKVCRHEVNEIEICPDCYFNSCTKKSQDWFCEPCRIPHSLVWAKMRGYPYWPAKALRVVDQQVDCRFFGEHDRAWVPMNAVFMLSRDCPFGLKKKIQGLRESLFELKKHIDLLIQKHGTFQYAKVRTPYDSKFRQQEGIQRPENSKSVDMEQCETEPSSHSKWNSKAEEAPVMQTVLKSKKADKIQPIVVHFAMRLKAHYIRVKKNLELKRASPICKKYQAKRKNCASKAKAINIAETLPVASDLTSKEPESKDITKKTESCIKKDNIVAPVVGDNPAKSDQSESHSAKVQDKVRPEEVTDNHQGFHAAEVLSVQTSQKNTRLARVVDKCKEKLGIADEEQLSVGREEGELSDSSSVCGDQNSSSASSASGSTDSATDADQPASSSTDRAKPSRTIRPPAYLADFDSLDSSDSERLVIDEDSDDGERPSAASQTSDNVPIKRKRLASPKRGNIIRRKRQRVQLDIDAQAMGLSAGQLRMLQNSGKLLELTRASESSNTKEVTAEAAPAIVATPETAAKENEDIIDTKPSAKPMKMLMKAPKVAVRTESHDSSDVQEVREIIKEENSAASISNKENFPEEEANVEQHIAEFNMEENFISGIPVPQSSEIIDDTTVDMSTCLEQIGESFTAALKSMTESWIQKKSEEFIKKKMEQQLNLYRWQQEQELREIKYNRWRSECEELEFVQTCVTSAVEDALEEQRQQMAREKEVAVAETKKKQWCAQCGAEAYLFCCWNTSYCDYPCQKEHWPRHLSSCQQNGAVSESGGSTQSTFCTLGQPPFMAASTKAEATHSIQNGMPRMKPMGKTPDTTVAT